MANKGLAKAKRCRKLKSKGDKAGARQAGCKWQGLSGGRKGKTLRGHVRTCIQFACVKGRGADNEEAACKRGYVLRCAVYTPEPGIPRTAATRKDYQEFTYGKYNRGSGARSIFPPFKAALLQPMQKRMKNVPRGSVQPGPGRK